jgi:hypothetical protein
LHFVCQYSLKTNPMNRNREGNCTNFLEPLMMIFVCSAEELFTTATTWMWQLGLTYMDSARLSGQGHNPASRASLTDQGAWTGARVPIFDLDLGQKCDRLRAWAVHTLLLSSQDLASAKDRAHSHPHSPPIDLGHLMCSTFTRIQPFMFPLLP